MKRKIKSEKDLQSDQVNEKIIEKKWPIVYRQEYNVNFFGLQKLHPFDAAKWRNIFQYLQNANLITEDSIFKPDEANVDLLRLVHTKRYLNSLKWSWTVASIAEIPPLLLVPNWITDKCYLKPMRYQVGGSVLAGELALQHGWAINIGGGFHHCSSTRGGGFCPYADITILIKWLLKFCCDKVKTAMIVDLDAHQGNGYQRDFLDNNQVFIMDVYNKDIYPKDEISKKAILCKIELDSYTSDSEYLNLIERNLEKSLQKFHPDMLVYNAGTDILTGDPLGRLDISPEGIIRRDELVFMKARERRVPIVMLTSGGYIKKTADIIAQSILNLEELNLISK